MVAGVLKDACDAARIPMADAAMRWCKHHSILDADVGDGIIFGASSSSHAEHNIAAYGAGPLPDTIVKAMDAAYVDSSLCPQCPQKDEDSGCTYASCHWFASGGRLHAQTPSHTFVGMVRRLVELRRY